MAGDLFHKNSFATLSYLTLPFIALLIVCNGCSYRPHSRSTNTEELLGRDVTEGRVVEGRIGHMAPDGNGTGTGQVCYRVQLLASTLEEEAESLLEVAMGLFSENVYVEYFEPYYKIRVGDFLEKKEAEVMRERAYELGFVDAWIVETISRPVENGSGQDE